MILGNKKLKNKKRDVSLIIFLIFIVFSFYIFGLSIYKYFYPPQEENITKLIGSVYSYECNSSIKGGANLEIDILSVKENKLYENIYIGQNIFCEEIDQVKPIEKFIEVWLAGGIYKNSVWYFKLHDKVILSYSQKKHLQLKSGIFFIISMSLLGLILANYLFKSPKQIKES